MQVVRMVRDMDDGETAVWIRHEMASVPQSLLDLLLETTLERLHRDGYDVALLELDVQVRSAALVRTSSGEYQLATEIAAASKAELP